MCDIESRCNYKPLYGIDKRVGFSNKPCEIDPLYCEVFRDIMKQKRIKSAYSTGQLNLLMRLVNPQ